MLRALALTASFLALPAAAEELLVFAASSTAPPLEELARGFETRTGTRVRFAFGASNDLARQITAGAAADVFLSADLESMDRLEGQRLVHARDRAPLLSNQLVVVVPAGSRVQVAGPEGLASFKRVAIADPRAVPLGVYARRWLEQTGAWAEVAPKVIPTLDARAALAAVEAGNADAGVVYRTDAALSKKVRIAYAVEGAQAPAIVYQVAVPWTAKRPALARSFVEMLKATEAAKLFARYGFGSVR